jgi:transketolase
MGDFPKGRNLHFGIREHSMAAITNAMALYGTTIPFNATFFVFSDYLKPAARIAALTGIQNFFVWTHDSIGVGEDGPTHEPIEHISQFRALPNFYVWRPADATENVEAWKTALTIQAPHGFVLSRQKLKTLKPKRDFGEVSKGAYIVKQRKDANFTLMASGWLQVQSLCLVLKQHVTLNRLVSLQMLSLFHVLTFLMNRMQNIKQQWLTLIQKYWQLKQPLPKSSIDMQIMYWVWKVSELQHRQTYSLRSLDLLKKVS